MESVDSATSENEFPGEADEVSGGLDRSSPILFGKSRKPNWTSYEIRSLIEGYSRNRDIMRSRGVYRSTGERAVGNAQRQGVWEAITKEVNKSRPDYPRAGGPGPFGYSCVRTVKEVVKKWVNLVNRMKSELAIKRSNPRFELSATSRAVYTIVHTNDPVQLNDNSYETSFDGETATIVKVEPTDPGDWDLDSNNSNSIEVADSENDGNAYDQYQKKYRPILPASEKPSHVPSNLRSAILKRQLQQNGNHSTEYSSSYRNSDGPSAAKRSSLDSTVDQDSNSYMNDTHSLSHLEQDVDELKESYRLNKEILELQKRKLELEIEKTIVEKEKMEIEKEKSLIEKETKTLEKEITRFRKEMMELKLNKMKQMINEKTIAESTKSSEEDEILIKEEAKDAEDESDVQ